MPALGDVFAFRLECEDEVYRFGRVVSTQAALGPMKHLIVIYVFDGISHDIATLPSLNVKNLLLPPLIVNAMPWSKGYFQTVANKEFDEDEKLSAHIFVDSRNWFFDMDGKRIDAPLPNVPVGLARLNSIVTFAEHVEIALGYQAPYD